MFNVKPNNLVLFSSSVFRRRAAASGQSQDLHDLRREAAAIYRQGQRAILLEALEEMRAMTDQVGA